MANAYIIDDFKEGEKIETDALWSQTQIKYLSFYFYIKPDEKLKERLIHKLKVTVNDFDHKICQYQEYLKTGVKKKGFKEFITTFSKYKGNTSQYYINALSKFIERKDTISKSPEIAPPLRLVENLNIEIQSLNIYDYLETWEEELALAKFKLELKRQENIDFNETIGEFHNHREFFLGNKSLKGIGTSREGKKRIALNEVYNRIMQNRDNLKRSNYLPQKEYSLAYRRYQSIAERCFERFVNELFFKNYYMDNQLNFLTKNEIPDENVSTENKINKVNYAKLESIAFNFDSEFGADPLEISEIVQDELREFYQDMAKVRIFNSLLDKWKQNHKSKLDKNRKDFDLKFEQLLPHENFIVNFFGKNNDKRICEYCKLSEDQIIKLNQAEMIFTKRFYSRGKTMEVDQVDAYKGYTLSNIVLSCYWCNNAKTDEFTEQEFKEIAKTIGDVWKKRMKKSDL